MLDEAIGDDVVDTVEGKMISLVSLEDSLRFKWFDFKIDEFGVRLSKISFLVM